MEDYKVMLLTIENRRLVEIIERKTEMIRVLLRMVEEQYPGLTDLMTTDAALKVEKRYEE